MEQNSDSGEEEPSLPVLSSGFLSGVCSDFMEFLCERALTVLYE